jgi:gliding motility associated protien GldN
MRILFIYVFLIVGGASEIMAQQPAASEIIKPEVYPEYVMFRKTITRRMNLLEKQNKSFISKNSELHVLLIRAVKEGLLKPYKTDSCINLMTDQAFLEATQFKLPDDVGFGGGFGGGFGDDTSTDEAAAADNFVDIDPSEFNKLYIKEDMIFDRNRSRMYYYIRSLTLYIPTNPNYDINFEKKIASFRYDDVMALLRGPYQDVAKWFNEQNEGAHMNMADAFELRLFSAPIVGVSNSENLDIRQKYGDEINANPLNAMIIQQRLEMELMEYESNLWEN